MNFSKCVKNQGLPFLIMLQFASLVSGATHLAAPSPKKSQDYNYTNGDVGSNALGLSSADAADFNETDLPLDTPKLKPAEIVDETTAASAASLEREKNSPECLDSCNK